MSSDASVFNYVMLSDVHLGSDLVQHAAPWTARRLAEQRAVDRHLVTLLQHYRRTADAEHPWKLVLAGDFIDFVGMSVNPLAGTASSPPKHEDMRHGLGNASEHSAEKMRLVVQRHPTVFAAMGAFVLAGHHLVMVRGNHDVELYWEAAQAAFVQGLIDIQERPLSDEEQAALRSRVEFRDWFYYEPGVLYVEHGHQYDETCAYHHQLAPLCPDDPSRLSYSFSDILMRYIVRPTRGLSSDGHENRSITDYLRLAASLGVGGCARLSSRFGRALLRMVEVCRSHSSERVQVVMAEQERRLLGLAQSVRLRVEQLRALSALGARPVTSGLGSIARTVFLDSLAALALVALLTAGLLWSGWVPMYWVAALGVAGLAPIATRLVNARVLDPDACLQERAAEVVRVMPAQFVVMGHTHYPRFDTSADFTYINLGWWAGDESEEPVGEEPPRSHLVLRMRNGTYEAQLLSWDADTGCSALEDRVGMCPTSGFFGPGQQASPVRAAS